MIKFVIGALCVIGYATICYGVGLIGNRITKVEKEFLETLTVGIYVSFLIGILLILFRDIGARIISLGV